MAEKPWVRWFASDFLNGVADMEADERGVYITVLSLIFDKGGPITDDATWLARRSGCSTRRFNQIRKKLIDDGKLVCRGGLLGNRKALEEVKRRDSKSTQARDAANARWASDDQPELPIETGAKEPIISGKKRQTSREQIDLNGAFKSEKPQKSANSADADAPGLAGAREEPEPELEESSPATLPSNPAKAADADDDSRWDLLGITNRIARAGAVSLHRETTRAAAMDLVKGWLQQGIDVEATIIPTVERCLTDTKETSIGSLAFYASAVLKAHSQSKRKPKPKTEETPDPIFEFEGEDHRFVDLRKDLFGAMGGWSYARFAHQVRFTADRRRNGHLALIIKQTGAAQYAALRLMDGERISVVTRIAKQHGFDEAW